MLPGVFGGCVFGVFDFPVAGGVLSIDWPRFGVGRDEGVGDAFEFVGCDGVLRKEFSRTSPSSAVASRVFCPFGDVDGRTSSERNESRRRESASPVSLGFSRLILRDSLAGASSMAMLVFESAGAVLSLSLIASSGC